VNQIVTFIKKMNDYKKKKEIEEDKKSNRNTKTIEVLYNAKMNIRE